MATPINMPQVGQDLETAVITEWKVKEGDVVKVGDVIALVESDKAVFEVEAFAAGRILKLLYAAGDEGTVFEPIAYLGEEMTATGERRPEAEEEERGKGRRENEERKKEKGEGERGKGGRSVVHVQPSALRVFASPSARRLARQYDVDLTALAGSGPNGRIVKEDILDVIKDEKRSEHLTSSIRDQYSTTRTSAKSPTDFAADQVIPFSKIRQTIADRMTHSATTIPHFYLTMDVDMTPALAWRTAFNAGSVKVSVNDLIVKAVAISLAKYPKMNAHVEQDKMTLKSDVNIGVAVSVEDGLIVPVLPNTNQLSVTDIARLSRELADAAKRGIIKTSAPGTFTISNIGMYGVSHFMPVINPPEAGILGVGAVEKRLVAFADGTFGARDSMTLTLASDHRAVDGVYAAEFLGAIKNYLEKRE